MKIELSEDEFETVRVALVVLARMTPLADAEKTKVLCLAEKFRDYGEEKK